MNRSRWYHVLMESGLCIDRVRLLEWLLKSDRARIAAFRFFRLRFSPAILDNALQVSSEPGETGRLFSLGMSHINVGDTYKTTTSERTVLADETVIRLARMHESPGLLEIGVSDGSSSLELLRHKSVFSRIVLSDRFSHFYERRIPFGRIFLDSDGGLLGIKFLCFYINLALSKARDVSLYSRIETINPVVRKLGGIEQIETFNALLDKLSESVHIIKCSNVLNKSYFSDDQIIKATRNLANSLLDGGSLVISHNNVKYTQGEAVLVLRKEANGFHVAENLNQHELASLFESSDGERCP